MKNLTAAQLNLGVMYVYGRGVAQDSSRAYIRWSISAQNKFIKLFFYVCYIKNNELFQIKLLKEMKLVKKKKNKGYNFFATKNNDFINILKKN